MSQSNAATSEAVLPDNLLEQVELGSPKGHILVRGTVLRLKLYPEGAPKWVYGELLGVNQAIAFRCPVGYSPRREGEAVVIGNLDHLEVWEPGRWRAELANVQTKVEPDLRDLGI